MRSFGTPHTLQQDRQPTVVGGLGRRRFADVAFQGGGFRTCPRFQKSAGFGRQEISTLSAHQMAHAGVVAHSSSWTPAASELEESSPPLDSHMGGRSELPDGRREEGDKVVCILTGLTAGNAAGYRGGVINTGIEDILVLPAVPVVTLLPGPLLRDGFSHVLGLRIECSVSQLAFGSNSVVRRCLSQVPQFSCKTVEILRSPCWKLAVRSNSLHGAASHRDRPRLLHTIRSFCVQRTDRMSDHCYCIHYHGSTSPKRKWAKAHALYSELVLQRADRTSDHRWRHCYDACNSPNKNGPRPMYSVLSLCAQRADKRK